MTEIQPDADAAEADGAALLPILIAPHKTLKLKARAITPADMDQVRAIVPGMFASMYKAPASGWRHPR